MKTRWLAAGIAALLITGGAATVAQRVITQMTRGVLPEKNDPAHPDSRQVFELIPKAAPTIQASTEPPIVALADSGPSLPAPGSYTTEETTGAGTIVVEPPAAPVLVMNEASTVEPPLAIPASNDGAITPASGQVLPETRMIASEPAIAQDVPGKLDPVDSVETFVERNRKEAESAIQTLSIEAETLKTRLAKVETALTRWQSFSRALNADQPASQPSVAPGSKVRWERPSPEGSSRPVKSEGTMPTAIEPIPDLIPMEKHSQPSTSPSVPTQAEPPVTPPTEPKPIDLPSTEPSSLPPPTSSSARNEA